MTSVFITGATGFIGRSLLQKIDPERYSHIYCLSRNHSALKAFPSTQYNNCQFIDGNIFDYKAYATYLAASDTVIHLAAATGKATREEHFAINAEGTQFLIEQCRQTGVKNFLHISTIAVKFVDKSRYYYAQSKELAEQIVKNSGLHYTIVRPTIVIGQDATTWKTLLKLSKLPITPIFGDGTTKIQPIYIDDLVDCLLLILRDNMFSNETIELGGPEEITFEKFLKNIHCMYYGKEPPIIHIPLKQLINVLSFFENRFYSILPVTIGQLSSFKNDGTIEKNRIFRHQAPRMKNVHEMLRLVIHHA